MTPVEGRAITPGATRGQCMDVQRERDVRATAGTTSGRALQRYVFARRMLPRVSAVSLKLPPILYF